MFHVACMDFGCFSLIVTYMPEMNGLHLITCIHACMVDAYRYIMMYMHAMCMYLNTTHMLHT